MKLKKRFVFLFVVIILLIPSTILLNKSNIIEINTIGSKSLKKSISYEVHGTTNDCDRYYSGVGTRVFSYKDVDERYPMYVYQNCAVSFSYYIEKTKDSSNACSVLEEYITQNEGKWNQYDESLVNLYKDNCGNMELLIAPKDDGIKNPKCTNNGSNPNFNGAIKNYDGINSDWWTLLCLDGWGYDLGFANYMNTLKDDKAKKQACEVQYEYLERIKYSDEKYVDDFNSTCHKYYEEYPLLKYTEAEKNRVCRTKGKDYTGIINYYERNDDEEWPMYCIDGWGYNFDDYVNRTNDKNNACDSLKKYTEYSWNQYVKETVDDYNNHCEDITGHLDTKVNTGISCDEAIEKINLDPVGNWYLYQEAFVKTSGVCHSYKNRVNIPNNKYYIKAVDGQVLCEGVKVIRNGKPYDGILKKDDTENSCDYDLILLDGSATTAGDYYEKKGSLPSAFCSSIKSRLQNNYVTHIGEKEIYDNYCTPKTDTYEFIKDVKSFTPLEGSECKGYPVNLINKYNNVLAPTIVIGKNEDTNVHRCDWNYYYVNGWPTSFETALGKIKSDGTRDPISDKVSEAEKKVFCQRRHEELSNITWTNETYLNQIDDYNNLCISSGRLDSTYELTYDNFIKVIFDGSDSYGLNCPSSSSSDYSINVETNQCIYLFKKSFAEGKSSYSITNLPITSGIKQNTTGAVFAGWKDSSNNTYTGNSINVDFTKGYTTITYTPFYNLVEKKELGYSLYQSCDGSFKEKDSSLTHKTNVNNTAILTSTIQSVQEYKTTSTHRASVKHGNSFEINKFCSIKCTENVWYKYPTLFETVKAGTYFEILKYPDVTAWLTCGETYSHNYWLDEYNKSITAENNAYYDYKNSGILDSPSIGNCCDWDCDQNGCTCVAKTIYANIYNYDGSTRNVSCCGCSNLKARAGYPSSTSTYLGIWNAKKSDRFSYQNDNKDCFDALTKDANSFYNIDTLNSEINFYYESSFNNINNTKQTINGKDYYKDRLNITNIAPVKDSNVYYSDGTLLNASSDKGSKIEINYPGVSGSDAYYIPYLPKETYIERSVERTFVYGHSTTHKKLYSQAQSGNIVKESDANNNDTYLGYVYPVPLNVSGSRNVYFEIKLKTNLDYGAIKVLDSSSFTNSNLNVYKCSYDITNDIITKKGEKIESGKTVEEFRKNFYVRSISTENVDPNDRLTAGKFGANWDDVKGKSLIEMIQKKAQSNDTYNPNNLEYSFTLNATTIQAIRDYNKGKKYSDFDKNRWVCNDMNGECKSKFLDDLADNDGKFNGEPVGKIDAYIRRNETVASKNTQWKYYVKGNWYKVKSIDNLPNTSQCSSKYSSIYPEKVKKFYDCIYRDINEGVLP